MLASWTLTVSEAEGVRALGAWGCGLKPLGAEASALGVLELRSLGPHNQGRSFYTTVGMHAPDATMRAAAITYSAHPNDMDPVQGLVTVRFSAPRQESNSILTKDLVSCMSWLLSSLAQKSVDL